MYKRQLPHYFFEFDILDKQSGHFLTLDRRLEMLSGTGIETVPVVHRGAISKDKLQDLIVSSEFGATFEHPATGQMDDVSEGIYLRTEDSDKVTSRSKMVRPEFTEKIKQSKHWQYEKMVPNELAAGADVWK